MSGITARRHRKRKLKAEINVVPYIDVMLVLLIIFMVTAPLLTLGVDVDLPRSNAKSIETKNDPVVVQIDAKGNYFLAVKAGSNEAVTRDMLRARMTALVAQNGKEKLQVYIAGDGRSNYQPVMEAMEILQGAGVEKVGLMSQPQKGAAR
ncbi:MULTISPECIES: protein TolR [unclassified Lysobacter]|uniref:protein TolR n=1 Tax=unclassified Lysobacter TaxID=2635362 RepID=UPI0006FE8049|nr:MULTISPECIES: protein TolR [unclassified Lysobacter]KQZ66575.1 protein TolR [Lysobacter sp. Root559]KRA72048.1 protein TolR [Lysobacter sp. Root667]KRC32727.1 protein TolR [Lysobacter sp. Root76]KRD67929.1 protein TolR [Lysobacter sp. Root96]